MKSSSGKRSSGSVNKNKRDNNIYSDSRMIKKKKKSSSSKFLASFLCFLLIFLGCFTIGGAVYFLNMQNGDNGANTSGTESNSQAVINRRDKIEYFLIAGIDDAAYLSDVIILMAYDKVKNEVNL